MSKELPFEANLRVARWSRKVSLVYEEGQSVEKEILEFEGELIGDRLLSARSVLDNANFRVSVSKQTGGPEKAPVVLGRCDQQGNIRVLLGFFEGLSPASFYALYRNLARAQETGGSGVITIQGEEIKSHDSDMKIQAAWVSIGVEYTTGGWSSKK